MKTNSSSDELTKNRAAWVAAGFTIEDAGDFNRAAVKTLQGVSFFVSNEEGTDAPDINGECHIQGHEPVTHEYLGLSATATGLEAVEHALLDLAQQFSQTE